VPFGVPLKAASDPNSFFIVVALKSVGGDVGGSVRAPGARRCDRRIVRTSDRKSGCGHDSAGVGVHRVDDRLVSTSSPRLVHPGTKDREVSLRCQLCT
jgi:hypothetical protein